MKFISQQRSQYFMPYVINNIMWFKNSILLATIMAVSVVVATSDDKYGGIGTNCLQLKNRYNSTLRYVYLFGVKRNVSIQYGRHAPSRAKAALLVAGLRYRLGYEEISMEPGENSYCELVQSLPSFRIKSNSIYNKLVAHTAAEWAGADENCPALKDTSLTLAGPSLRMQIVPNGGAPVQLRLHAHLKTGARNDKLCSGAHTWPFYTNESALRHCGFLDDLIFSYWISDSSFDKFDCSEKAPCVPVLLALESGKNSSTLLRLLDYAAHAKLRLRPILLKSDNELRRHLNNATTSFLFLDYDLWTNNTSKTRVRIVQPPPCYTTSYPCQLEIVSALFVADTSSFAHAAPLLYEALVRIAPFPTELHDVLNKSIDLGPEEAACQWANEHRARFDSWTNTEDKDLWAAILLCNDEPTPDYNNVIAWMNVLINETVSEIRLIYFQVAKPINCTDPNSINHWFNSVNRNFDMITLVGVIAVGEGASAAAASFKDDETQIVFYDVPGAVQLNDAAWAVAGRALPLACAIADFIVQQNWIRVAIISEDTSIADEITKALFGNKTITFDNKKLEAATEEAAFKTLSDMKELDVRIFFVNARASVAAMVLCAAAAHGLTSDANYAWIVREWRVSFECKKNTSTDLVYRMRPFTVSYWWRGGDDNVPGMGGDKKIRETISQALNGSTWPLMTAPLADAMLLLAHSVAASLRQSSWRRYDLHGSNAARMVSKSYTRATDPVAGVVQELRQHNHAQHQPLVFVHAWLGNNSKLLQIMKMDDNGVILKKHILHQAYEGAVPYGGEKPCITILTGSDKFNRQCQDVLLFGGVAFLVIMLLGLWLARRARIRRLKYREREIHMRLLARCERTASALSGHLIQRSALQIYEELGLGHFGRVRRGMLCLKQGRNGRTLVCVAVKALRADAAAAEEAEFLREACALASLQHDHVVKLIGVCAADGPPLLLMEHAFYGDLLRYLRERRHLALLNLENPNGFEGEMEYTEEAAHVSPTQLTRLAREAADALLYLSQQRFVHRDVRASNCLLDQHRSLKLADFGMARKTGHTATKDSTLDAPDDYSYICRRRGVFPVPWMAPESVIRGIFSSMSDVWSLGVMILEICSLGARPFGTWESQRVLDHVRSGAYPPLPSDLTYHTREVLEMCWRLVPESRYTAAEIKAHLTGNPTAVRPALHPACSEEEPDETQAPDSGFGEQDGDNWPRSQPHISAF